MTPNAWRPSAPSAVWPTVSCVSGQAGQQAGSQPVAAEQVMDGFIGL